MSTSEGPTQSCASRAATVVPNPAVFPQAPLAPGKFFDSTTIRESLGARTEARAEWMRRQKIIRIMQELGGVYSEVASNEASRAGKGGTTASAGTQQANKPQAVAKEVPRQPPLPNGKVLTPFVLSASINLFMRFMVVVGTKAKVDAFVAGVACVLLGTKVEEQNVKLRDIMCTMYDLFFGLAANSTKRLRPDSDKYKSLRDKVTRMEMSVLRAVAFDFIIDHPHRHLLVLFSGFEEGEKKGTNGRLLPVDEARTARLAAVKATAFTIVHDSYRTPLMLRTPAPFIAAAALMFACAKEKHEPRHGWAPLAALLRVPEDGLWTIVAELRRLHEIESGIPVKAAPPKPAVPQQPAKHAAGSAVPPAVGSVGSTAQARPRVSSGPAQAGQRAGGGGWQVPPRPLSAGAPAPVPVPAAPAPGPTGARQGAAPRVRQSGWTVAPADKQAQPTPAELRPTAARPAATPAGVPIVRPTVPKVADAGTAMQQGRPAAAPVERLRFRDERKRPREEASAQEDGEDDVDREDGEV